MRLVKLIYASTIKNTTDPSELNKILETATTTNPKENITGILLFGNDYFLQCLEGGRNEVNRLYHKIATDNRHEFPTLLDYGEIPHRNFEEWAMKLVMLTAKKMNIVKRYSPTSEFNPYTLSGQSALNLLIAFSKKDD